MDLGQAADKLFRSREPIQPLTLWDVTGKATRVEHDETSIIIAEKDKVTLVERETGKVAWESPVNSPVATALHHGDTTVLGFDSGSLVGVGPDGQTRWSTRAAPREIWGLEHGAGDTVIARGRGYGGLEYLELGLDPDNGEILWKHDDITFSTPQAVGDLQLTSSFDQLQLVEPRSGKTKARARYESNVHDPIATPEGEVWALYGQSVQKVHVKDGFLGVKLKRDWTCRTPSAEPLAGLALSPDHQTIFATSQEENGLGQSPVFGVDASTGKLAWKTDVRGAKGVKSESLTVTTEGNLVVPGTELTCLGPDGSVRWTADVGRTWSSREVPGGLAVVASGAQYGDYRVSLLDPASGETVACADLTRMSFIPQVDAQGRILAVGYDHVSLLLLPAPEEPEGQGGMQERGSEVIVGGVVLPKRT